MIEGSGLLRRKLITTLSGLSNIKLGNSSDTSSTVATVIAIVGMTGLAYNFIIDKLEPIRKVLEYAISSAKRLYKEGVELVTGALSKFSKWLSEFFGFVPKAYNAVTSWVSSGVDYVKNLFSLGNNPAAMQPDPKAVPATQAKIVGKLRKGSPEIDEAIRKGARLSGEREDLLRTFIDMESYGDPKAKSGSFLGLGQIGPDAWEDIQRYHKIKLPPLTGKDDDPRYDPVTNAYATGLLMRQNREYLKGKGIPEPTLAQLYIAHNVGRSRAVEVLTKSSSEWSDKTNRAIGNQASALISGGVANYVSNVETTMASTYVAVNNQPAPTTLPQPAVVAVQQPLDLSKSPLVVPPSKNIPTPDEPKPVNSDRKPKTPAVQSQHVTLLKTKIGLVAAEG